MNKAPAYQMYANDWISSRNVRLFTDYQRGWYIQLLNEAWAGDPQCMLPNNIEMLQTLAGISDATRALPDFNDRWTAVQLMFTEDGDYVYNERQMVEYSKQEQNRKNAQKAGLKSAKIREERRLELQRIKTQHITNSNERSTDAQRKGNGNPTLLPSTSSSISTSSLSSIIPPNPQGEREPFALRASKYILCNVSKALGRKLTSKPNAKPIEMLMKAGVTEDQINVAVKFLCAEYRKGTEYIPVVHSGKALREKWDKIQAAMVRVGKKPAIKQQPQFDDRVIEPYVPPTPEEWELYEADNTTTLLERAWMKIHRAKAKAKAEAETRGES